MVDSLQSADTAATDTTAARTEARPASGMEADTAADQAAGTAAHVAHDRPVHRWQQLRVEHIDGREASASLTS